MKEIEYWDVKVIADCEGRSMKTIASFSNEKAASNYAASDIGRDMYGLEGKIIKQKLTLFETSEDAGATTKIKLKESALSKLTSAEISALGLQPPCAVAAPAHK